MTARSGWRDPASYVHGTGEDAVVVLPARAAALLDRLLDLRQLRVKLRGNDPQIDSALLGLALAAEHARAARGTSLAAPASGRGRTSAEAAEAAATSSSVSSSRAAVALGISPRAVRLALAEGRLSGRKVDGTWRVDAASLADVASAAGRVVS